MSCCNTLRSDAVCSAFSADIVIWRLCEQKLSEEFQDRWRKQWVIGFRTKLTTCFSWPVSAELLHISSEGIRKHAAEFLCDMPFLRGSFPTLHAYFVSIHSDYCALLFGLPWPLMSLWHWKDIFSYGTQCHTVLLYKNENCINLLSSKMICTWEWVQGHHVDVDITPLQYFYDDRWTVKDGEMRYGHSREVSCDIPVSNLWHQANNIDSVFIIAYQQTDLDLLMNAKIRRKQGRWDGETF